MSGEGPEPLVGLAARPGDVTAGRDPTGDDSRRSATPAFAVLLAMEAVALPLLLSFGRDRWFQFDEWDFLASRDASSLHDLFAPHDVHWVTLPILLYRFMWTIFGIRTYVPYQTLSVLAHLAVVTLIWCAMRRAGVRPWTSTATATVLLLLGSGQEHIVWAFMVTWGATLALGLAHLLLADHDGPWARRDSLGLVAGFAALMCSGLAVPMTVAVGVAVVIRRGWAMALLHTVPLAATYLLWLSAIGRDGLGRQTTSSFGDVLVFAGDLVAHTFQGLARSPVLACALGGVLIGGLCLAWWHASVDELRTRVAVPVGLLAASLTFIAITGSGRADRDIDSNDRYIYVVAVLVLPALAVGVDAIMKRWRLTVPVFGALLAISVVGNVREFRDESAAVRAFRDGYRETFLTLPRLPVAAEIPRNLYDAPGLAPWVSFGWLRDGVASGRIPAPDPLDPVIRATMEGRLVLRQQASQPRHCEPMRGPVDLRMEQGSSIRISGPTSITYTNRDGTTSLPIEFQPSGRRVIVAFAPARVRIGHDGGATRFALCDPDGAAISLRPGPP